MPEIWIIAVHYENGAIDKVRFIKSDSTRRVVRAVHPVEPTANSLLDADLAKFEEDERENVLLWIKAHDVHVLTARAVHGGPGWGAFERGAVVEPTPDGHWITTEADGVRYTNLEHLLRY